MHHPSPSLDVFFASQNWIGDAPQLGELLLRSFPTSLVQQGHTFEQTDNLTLQNDLTSPGLRGFWHPLIPIHPQVRTQGSQRRGMAM